MTSHDVVNACRRIFGERRVGHTGTLDPLATGVLLICVGPATRLDQYLVGHIKTYEARIAFGAATDTCDAWGTVIERAQVPSSLMDESVARSCLAKMLGSHMQIPPAFSAIKVQGRRAYDEARAGRDVELEAREVVISKADLLGISSDEETGFVNWDVVFSVSPGTYVRALARDLGIMLSCPAHIASLRRTYVGPIGINECVTLEELEVSKTDAAIDPVPLLGYRVAIAKGEQKAKLANGNPFSREELDLFVLSKASFEERLDACSSLLSASDAEPFVREPVCILSEGTLKAIYAFDAERNQYRARTIFSQGVFRG